MRLDLFCCIPPRGSGRADILDSAGWIGGNEGLDPEYGGDEGREYGEGVEGNGSNGGKWAGTGDRCAYTSAGGPSS